MFRVHTTRKSISFLNCGFDSFGGGGGKNPSSSFVLRLSEIRNLAISKNGRTKKTRAMTEPKGYADFDYSWAILIAYPSNYTVGHEVRYSLTDMTMEK